MFYSVQLLGKTSPLGKLWLAAHADKRLKRQDINSTDVPQSVEQIIQPSEGEGKMPLALRLSGLLLLGLVKIYSRQLQYLQEDCLTAVQELDKADKVAGLGKGQNKQQRKNAKLALANQQDVTIDEPRQFFRLSSLSDEEGFGLFEESHAGMAMAAQAHASFMNMEYSLSQSDPRDDSAMVHLDEPEQLRAVPVDFEDEMEPALPFGDELPRMTPTKRLGRSASRDRTPEAMKTDQAEMSNLGPEPAPEDRDDSTLAAPLPIDDLPDLPPIVRPSAVAANGGAPEDGGPPAPEFYGTQNDGADVVVNIGERCQQESEAVPDDVQDHAPDPMPDVGSDIMPEITPDLDAHTLDEPMFDAPELPDDVEDINAKPLEKEAEAAASTDPRLDDACTGDQQGKTASRSPKGKQSRQTVSEAAGAISKRTRKRNAPKLRRDSDKESTTVSSEETRELLKNRTSLICKLPPIVSKTRLRSKPLNTDVLDVLLVPSAVQEPSLDNRIVRLFEAIGSCRPLSLNALRGDDESAGPDEIEDVVPAPDARGDQTNVTSTGAAEVEVLRDARPSVSGSHVVLPPLDQARLLEADEREGSQGNAGDAMLEDDALEMDMPAMVLPDVDVPQFAMTRADVQPLDMPSPEMPSPGMSPPEMPPGIPEAYGLSEAQPGHQGHIAELGGVHPAPPGGTSGMQTQSADAPHEYTPVGTLYTAPGTQGTGSAEDSSLNAHTLHTLERLERLTQILPDSRKRKQPEAISMSQLIETTDRPEAAKLFYDVLVLQAKGIVNIEQQDSPYSELQMILSSGQVYI